MDLKEGMYVRTKYGIGKIDETRIFINCFQIHLDSNKGKIHNVTDNTYWNYKEDIIKISNDIINLIEVGDYVNGCKVCEIDYAERGKYVMVEDNDPGWKSMYFNNDIKSVVTKDQFSQLEYKVG